MGTKEENAPLHAKLTIEVVKHGEFQFKMQGCALCIIDAIAMEAYRDTYVMAMLTAAMNKAWSMRADTRRQDTEVKALLLSNRQN